MSKLLTGGSGDVNPQYMGVQVQLSAVNVFTQATIQIPVNRLRVGRGRAWVTEILKIYVQLSLPEGAVAATEQSDTISWHVAYLTQGGILNLANANCIMAGVRGDQHSWTAAGTYYVETSYPQEIDMTDGAGHGVLIAVDQLFLGAVSTGKVGLVVVDMKVLFRFKEVGIAEFIGIVQSQQ